MAKSKDDNNSKNSLKKEVKELSKPMNAPKTGPKDEIIENELCPFCHEKTLTLMDKEIEVPYFGQCYVFSMDCSNIECNYHKADIESAENREPSKFTIDISSEEDMKIRVVKSSFAAIKLPHVGDISPGPSSNGYVTNIEGILNRMMKQLEAISNNEEEDEDTRKKTKNMIKKLKRVVWGQEKQRLIIEDPTGNSAIISEKAVKEKLKVIKPKD